MYYHAIVETNEKDKKGNYERCYELNQANLEDIIQYIVTPYVQHQRVYVDGRRIDYKNIRSLKIKSSERSLPELVDIAQANVSPGVLYIHTQISIVNSSRYVKDITKETIFPIEEKLGSLEHSDLSSSTSPDFIIAPKKVFIVHGHDELTKTKIARFIEKIDYKAIILHEQASGGKTIIEKIEAYTDVGFAIVLYTADDLGNGKDEASSGSLNNRARQNVIFEHGYLIAKLGRDKVVPLVVGDVEMPSDISGVVYVSDTNWQITIAKEMKQAGYAVDFNKLM